MIQKEKPVSANHEAERQIRRTLNSYCERIDSADFDGFARLFERGLWFMVDTPGVEPVLSWLEANIVLHDGKTHTRHEISNLDVEVTNDGHTAEFRCYVAIWQDLPASRPELMVHARFAGTFRLVDDQWWWSSHTMTPDFVGDLSQHIRGSATA
jgi:3-phenylpropionate/cinnamic acid dioxygenase small subunit